MPLDYADLFETAPCGYVLTDKEGRITRANATFAKWVGWAPHELQGRRFADLLPIAVRIFYESHVAPMLHVQGSVSEIALDVLHAEGHKLPMLINGAAVRDDHGQVASLRFAVFTATQRRNYEQTLLHSRNEAQASVLSERAESELREQFIAVLGHDLRNPLAAIAGGARMLLKEQLSERGSMILRLIDGSVVRAGGLIDNVLDFARGRLGGGITLTRNDQEPLEPVLRQVIGELRAISPDHWIDAKFAIDALVDCDHVRMGQLLSNLLGNALTHGAKDQSVRVRAETTDGSFIIAVANGGEPIPSAALERLFQPFFRGGSHDRQEGLGLGLHIASEIARAHGGKLTVSSDPVETCFTFTMPMGGLPRNSRGRQHSR
ncbi:PAS domain-containing sensor histidine kinase [Novosphingobium rosa]|uniref:PAS domain-containing sensor histidine kinase n=1 Tax=Novosphingobium rosa TaxID=76978 RepID=UPI0008367759|nr:PAS domain-containing sensor histidine kinase [Novosphingobium rosa]